LLRGADCQRGVDGVGIGLVLPSNLVEMMAGELRVESTVGEGSIFSVEFAMEQIPERSVGT